MPKALFFNVPAHGHVNPSLPLVAELVRRGHDITYYLTESYRARIEATGATFQPYTTIHDDYFESRGLDGTRPQKAARALIITTGEVLPELLDIVRREQPDYILFDGMCPWGKMVAQVTGIPSVASLALLPLGKPPLRYMLPMLGTVLPMLMRDIGDGFEAVNRSRTLTKQYKVAPMGLATILNSTGDLSISYTSSYFAPFADTLPDSIRFVGRSMSEAASDSSFSFDKVNGKPLIYVSLGTLSNDNAAFFKACIEAFAGGDYAVIMSTGNRITPESLGTLPDNIAVHSWVPQHEVLKRAALFITHGGLNSVHDGLYMGLPLLVVPQQDEQTLTGMRVVELGAGLMLKKPQVNAEALRKYVTQLLAESRFKSEAQRIGDSFRAAGGMSRAVDEIEALLKLKSVSQN